MLLIICVLSQAIGNPHFSVLLAFSNETSQALLSQFEDFSLRYEISPKSIAVDLLPLVTENEVLIVDISCNPFYFSFLDEASELIGTVYLTVTQSGEQINSRYRYFAHSDTISESDSISKLTNFLGWNKFTMLSSLKSIDFKIASEIKLKNPQAQISHFYYEENLTESKADFLIKRKVKAEGVKFLLIIDSCSSLRILENKLRQMKLIKEGFYQIVSSQGIYNTKIDGALIVSEPGTESSKSEASYHYLRVREILESIPPSKNFRVYLEKLCEYSKLCSRYIINILGSNKKKVGLITDTVNITDSIIYPGNSSSLTPNDKNSKIVISIANGFSELYHQGFNPYLAFLYRGADYSVLRNNLLKEIENFDLELYSTNCGNTIFDSNWFLSCFTEILPNMGVAYLTGIWDEVLYGNMITLRALNLSIPQITPNGQDLRVYDKSLNPEIVSLSITKSEYYSSLLYFHSVFRWKSVILIGSDDVFSFSFFIEGKEFLIKYKYSIVNPIESQVFPGNYTREDFQKYKHLFSAIKNTGCRIFIIISVKTQLIIEGLYDIGLRKGDFIAVLQFETIRSINTTDIYQYKIDELLTGSLLHEYKDFIGDYGEMIKNEALAISNNTINFCIGFDSVLIIKEAILRLMAIGEDYEDPILLMNYIRLIKTIGCTGRIQINNYNNFRATAIVVLKQIYFDKENGDLLYNDVISIDKYGQTAIEISSEINWPVKTNEIPSNFIEKNSCGLDERLIRNSSESRDVFLIVSALLFFITLAFAIISAKLFNYNLPQIQKDTIQGLSEKVFLVFFMSEFFQLSLHGNRKGILYEVGSEVFELAGFDLISFFNYESHSFWEILKAFIAIEFVVCLLCCTEMFIPQRLYEKFYFLSKIQDLNQILLPLLGHIGFMPLISMTLNVYMCNEAISNDLQDSYLKLDCKTFCFKEKHMVFAIISFISIVSFLIPSIILRPYWDKISTSHIKTKPVYLAALSFFQVTIILANHMLSFNNSKIIGYVNSTIIALFLLFTIYIKPYNYEQANLIQKMILCLSFWDILFGCIFLNITMITIKVLQVIGMGIILIISGILLKKLERVFVSEENFPISNLIKFQFSRNPNEYLRSKSKGIDLLEVNRSNYLKEED